MFIDIIRKSYWSTVASWRDPKNAIDGNLEAMTWETCARGEWMLWWMVEASLGTGKGSDQHRKSIFLQAKVARMMLEEINSPESKLLLDSVEVIEKWCRRDASDQDLSQAALVISVCRESARYQERYLSLASVGCKAVVNDALSPPQRKLPEVAMWAIMMAYQKKGREVAVAGLVDEQQRKMCQDASNETSRAIAEMIRKEVPSMPRFEQVPFEKQMFVGVDSWFEYDPSNHKPALVGSVDHFLIPFLRTTTNQPSIPLRLLRSCNHGNLLSRNAHALFPREDRRAALCE